tara:strand:- start:1988 stop:2386 length:399 start_codon:yes stop_codon:yes gene_type:complete
MKNRKMMHAYSNAEQSAVVEADDPHALVAVMYDELLRSMRIFCENIEKKQETLELRYKHFSRSLAVIYALEKSLDFERGGEIAANLFRLYEYAREKLIEASKTEDPIQVIASIKSLEDIREAWRSTSKLVDK